MKNRFKSQFKDLLDKTAQTGREYAISICEDGSLGEVSEGNGETVRLTGKGCRKVVSTYHTHPQNYEKEQDAFFSAYDHAVSNELGHPYHCLGYFVKGKPRIMCGKPLDDKRTKVFMGVENAGRTINDMFKYNVVSVASYKQFYDVYRELGLNFQDSCREEL